MICKCFQGWLSLALSQAFLDLGERMFTDVRHSELMSGLTCEDVSIIEIGSRCIMNLHTKFGVIGYIYIII